jgi:branched-chain amino acid transport system permease protein
MLSSRGAGLKLFVREIWVVLALAILLATLVAVVTTLGSPELQVTITEMLIRLSAVVGLYIFVGNSGIFSFGHASFMCIGGYAAAWATLDPLRKIVTLPGLPLFLKAYSYPMLAAVGAAAALAGIVALVTGIVIMRLSDLAASIATFALLVIVNRVYLNWDAVTDGAGSIIGVPTPVGPWTALAFAIVAMAIAYWFQVSRLGIMLRASRDDDVAASSSAVNTVKVRLFAFILSAAVVGAAGALYAQFLGVLTVDTFYLEITFLLLAMLVVGGAGSLTGAVTGVLVVSVLIDVLRGLEQGVTIGGAGFALPPGSQEVGLGLLLTLILIFRSQGLTKGKELSPPRSLRD